MHHVLSRLQHALDCCGRRGGRLPDSLVFQAQTDQTFRVLGMPSYIEVASNPCKLFRGRFSEAGDG